MERFAIKIDKKLKANLYKICRLCGMDNEMEMIPIVTHDGKEQPPVDVDAEPEMCQKIHLLIGLSVTKEDKMPQTMCCLCVDKINDFYEFREMCYATNAQTRKLLGLKAIKKPLVDIKPKIEIKDESIVPNSVVSTTANKNGNRKRKSEEVALKEEPATSVFTKKKLRFSAPEEPAVKEEEPPVPIKKKLRFSSIEEAPLKKETTPINKKETTSNNKKDTTPINKKDTTPINKKDTTPINKKDTTPINKKETIPINKKETIPMNKKSKRNDQTAIEEALLKKEPSPPLPAVSNKKLRLATAALKEAATKKSKKGGKTNESKDPEVKEEIKEEIKEEPVPPPPAPAAAPVTPSTPKLKHGCAICKERFVSKVKLEAHTRTAHLPKIERFVCTACNEVLSKSFDIKNHQLWHKLSKTPYICGCCGESILNTYAYSRHLREHTFETPPALMVLDRECPQCHTSHATNFLYNTHPCAVKTKRCAGCNRLQRTEAEYMKHSAQCAKVYLNYSKHIMPTVEALEDAVRIKNENDVEAAAEEMARLTGVSLDMAPVVQLTRLSSPFIMAANQCVVIPPGLDDAASTSNKKSGKKGASKKDFRRVDELLKSTLDALVSIKHEPEVHVEPETPAAGDHSDNDDTDMADVHEDAGLDDFHHNNDDNDGDSDHNENQDQANQSSNVVGDVAETAEQIKIKQESDEAMNEENSNKVGGGLKLKIRKEHGQLNSSIIEQQQKSTEKRAEKRKKKKKHKDKEKDKQNKHHDEQISQDSNTNAEDVNTSSDVNATIRIKTEPQDVGGVDVDVTIAPLQTVRPQPEATIMTSIPMMQFQIACVSSGVEFTAASETQPAPDPAQTQDIQASSEPEDVKPNRQELDRILKISHVTSGIEMQINETDKVQEDEEDQQMEHHYNTDHHNDDDDNQSDLYENNQSDPQDEHNDDDHDDDDEEDHESETETEREKPMDIDNDNEIAVKKIKKRTLKPKPTIKPKLKPPQTVPVIKSRNKACKSTAKPPSMPILQISSIQSGVTLPIVHDSAQSEFTPIFIKPEPRNRGYADEQSTPALDSIPQADEEKDEDEQEQQEEENRTPTESNPEEEDYISSIDFNNITVKQEKDIEICDVQISRKPSVSCRDVNGIKRKRKPYQRRHNVVKAGLLEEEKMETDGDNAEDEGLEEQDHDDDTDEAAEDEEEDEEDEEDVEEEEEEEDEEHGEEEEEEEEEEEREYRELEYPPELTQKIPDIGEEIPNEKEETTKEYIDEKDNEKNLLEKEADTGINALSSNDTHDNDNVNDVTDNANETLPIVALPEHQTSFVIASVCSQANIDSTLLPNEKSENALNDEKPTTITTETNEDHDNNLEKSGNDTIDSSSANQTSTHLSQDSNLAPTTNHDPDIASGTISPNNLNVAEQVTHCDLASNLDQTDENSILDHPSTHLNINETPTSNINIEGNPHLAEVMDNSEQLHENTIKVLASPEIQETMNASEEATNLDENIHPTKIDDNDLESPYPQDPVLGTRDEQEPQDGELSHNVSPEAARDEQEPQDEELSHNVCPEADHHQDPPCLEEKTQDLLHAEQQSSQSHQYMGDKLQYSGNEPGDEPQYSGNEPGDEPQYSGNEPGDEPQYSGNDQTSGCFGQQTQTSLELEPPVFDMPSDLTTNPSNEEKPVEITQDESATIKGVVEQAKDIPLEAQPFDEAPPPPHTPNLNNDQNMVNDEDDDEDDDDDEEVEGEDEDDADAEINEEDATLDINLEEQQNHQNQEVFSQTRPAALALHPYLEDISSSSNSFLSNTLSQTPPPPTVAVLNTSSSTLNRPIYNEETENILNESNDVPSRSSEAVAVAVVPPIIPHLARQLPLQMPTFNFDNINEIAENNNNANIEREQLQDEQQQQHQQDHVT